MKLRLASIGKDRSGLFAPAVEEYAQRLTHYVKLQLLELPASKKQGALAQAEEGAALLKLLQPREQLICLDERGALYSSVELAQLLGRAQQQAQDCLFVIGGDEGLWPQLRERSSVVLSLSKMTLPHRLARVVLTEQLYRAFTVLKGEPYHK